MELQTCRVQLSPASACTNATFIFRRQTSKHHENIIRLSRRCSHGPVSPCRESPHRRSASAQRGGYNPMKRFLASRDATSKGAALLIALALIVLLAGLALAYFSRTTTDRQLAQSSYNDTSADLLARTALDIEVNDFKQEILSHPTVTPAAPFYITPVPYGTPTSGQTAIPNLIR